MPPNHLGIYQEPLPNNLVSAGIKVMRTTNASKRTPNASEIPMDLIAESSWKTKAINTLNIMSAAATMTGPLSLIPTRIE